MARVTVEDCVDKVNNRFELVALAAQRAKDINSGAPITIKRDNDKDPVIALREIALGYASTDSLRKELVGRLQTRRKIDPIEEAVTVENEEAQESFDYIPEGSDLYVSEDHSDLEEELLEHSDLDIEEKGF